MNLNGVPLRLNICNRQGECVMVKMRRPLLVTGSVVELPTEDVLGFITSVQEADDDLNTDMTAWDENFSLAKQRQKNKRHPEE